MYTFRFTKILQNKKPVSIYVTAKYSESGELEILQHRTFAYIPEITVLSDDISEAILENFDCIHDKKWSQEFIVFIDQEIKAKNYMYFLGETIDDRNEM